MKGRKPDSKAIRRASDKAEIAQAGESRLEKPISVMVSQGMSDLWDMFAGSGIAYKPEDAPFLEQLVFNLELAAECRDKCVDERGRIKVMIGCGEPDENGNYLDSKPNPYIKQMREAVAEAMKLSDQLGCTPLARARLGLTQAAGKAVTLSIADQIDEAMRRMK